MKWTDMKPQLEAEMDAAGITDKAHRRLILNLERRVNTANNRLAKGESWDSVCDSKPYNQGSEIFYKMMQDEALWAAYCKMANMDEDACYSGCF